MTLKYTAAKGSPETFHEAHSRLDLGNSLRVKGGKLGGDANGTGLKHSHCIWAALGVALVVVNTVLGFTLVHRGVHTACNDPVLVHDSKLHFPGSKTDSAVADLRQHSFTNSAQALTVTASVAVPTKADGTWQAIDDIKNASIIMVTFTNGYYTSLMLNWAYHVRALGLPYVVAVFDDTAATVCEKNGVRWIWADQQFTSANFRKDLAQFRMMGSMKPKLVLDLFEHGNFQAISLSDTDTAWLRAPQQLLDMHPLADMFISTDCLSHKAESEMKLNQNRCGHIHGSTYGCALNTGAIIFRKTPGAARVLEEWYAQLSNKTKDLIVRDAKGNATGMRLSDQMEMNLLLGVKSYPIKALPEDKRIILLMNRTVRVLPIPVLYAAAGHTYFYQHLQRNNSVVPFVVHTTFQRHGNSAKTVRFREEGMWLAEPPDYYDGDRKYVAYTNRVEEFIARKALEWERAHNGTAMAWHHRHMLAAAYQVAVLQDVWAVAKALNRTLILPEFMCYCDQDYYITVLQECKVVGSDLQLPFPCPVDVFINTDALEQTWEAHGVPYRTKSFLTSELVPLSVKRSRISVVTYADRAEYEAASANTLGTGAAVYARMNEAQMREALRLADSSMILAFDIPTPGMFGKFATSRTAQTFDYFFSRITQGLGWCCTGGSWDKQWAKVYWPYRMPPIVGSRNGSLAETTIPDMVRPAFCDTNELVGDAVDALKLPNHPCKYLKP